MRSALLSLVAFLLSCLTLSGQTFSARPRLIPADTRAVLVAKRTANTADWAGFYNYVWENRATTGRYTSSYLVPLLPLAYHAMADGPDREEIKTHGIRMMLDMQSRLMFAGRVTSVTGGASTLITVDQPHGIAAGASRRCYPAFFSGVWGPVRGERTCVGVDATTVSITSGTLNTSGYSAWTTNGEEYLYVKSALPEAQDFGVDSSRTQVWKYAFALDTWMPFLTTEQKESAVRWHRANLEFGTVFGGSTYWISDDFRSTGNLGTGRRMYAAVALAAIQGEATFITGAVTVESLWAELLVRAEYAVNIMNNGVLQGGSFPEGVEYSPQAVQYLARMFESIRGATGVNYWDQIPNWPAEVALHSIHSSSPGPGGSTGVRQPVPDGDTQDTVFEQYSSYVRYGLHYLDARLRASGNTALAARLKAWMNTYTPPESFTAAQEGWFERIQFADESFAPAANWHGPELWYHAAGNGRLYIRSSWNADATLMAFNAGRQLYDHLHAQAGGFHWWSNSKWATRKVISYGGAGFFNIGNNVLLAGGRGTVDTGGDAALTWHSGFSRVYVPTDQSYLYARANTGPLYPYRASMLTTDTSTYRDMVFFPSRNLLIGFDHCKFTGSVEKPCSFLIQSGVHFTTETVSANRFTLTEPDSLQRFDADVVEPAAPIITFKTHGAQYVTSAEPSGNRTLVMLSSKDPPDPMTVTGGVGEWAALNEIWDLSTTVGPGRANAVGSDTSAKLLNVDSSAFATQFAGQLLPYRTVQLNTVANRGTRKDWPSSGFTHVTSGIRANRSNHLFVMRGRANGASAPSQAPKLTATNLIATQVSDLVIGFVPTPTVTLPITYSYAPGTLVQHKLYGLTPSTAYNCDTSVAGAVTISAGSGCTANTAGVIEVGTSSDGTALKQLALAPVTGSTTCALGSGVQATQTLTLSVTGGSAPWDVASNQSYVAVSPASGSGTSGSITVTPSCSGLAVGTHNATITASSTDPTVTNAPQVAWSITVQSVTTVAVSSTSLVSMAHEFGSTVSIPSAQPTVTITGGGASCLLTSNAAWLTVSPTASFSTTQAAVIAAPYAYINSNLAAGIYDAAATLTCTGATPTVTTIPVRLTITQSTLSVTETEIQLAPMQIGDPLSTASVGVSRSGSGTPGFTASVTGPFTLVSAASGTLSSSVTDMVVRAGTGIQLGLNYGTLVITSPGASGSPVTIPLTLEYGPAPAFDGTSFLVSDTSAVVAFGCPDSRTPTVFWSLSANMYPVSGSSTNTVQALTTRFALVPGLNPSTQYFWLADCGTLVSNGQFTTTGAAAGTGALLLRLTPRPGIGAAKVRIEYGSTTALGTTNVVDCASGCAPSISATLGAMVHYRYTWLSASDVAVAPTSPIRSRKAQ